jgi:hypothetical protein
MADHRVHPHGELHNPDTAHEETDINIGAIATFVIGLTVVALVIHLAMWGLLKVLDRVEEKADPGLSPYAAGPATSGADFPGPSLQTSPWTDLKALRAEEAAHLHGYGWIDEPAGIARIPIDKAKALLLQKGLPVRPELADAAEGTRVAATGEASGGRNLAAGGADKSTPSAPSALPAGAKGAEGASGAQGAGATGATGATGAPAKKLGGAAPKAGGGV